MGWLYESLGILSAVLLPILHNFGFSNLHYPDIILMFVLIPFLHLMNDEETKAIIAEQNWYHGLRHMLGIYTPVVPISPQVPIQDHPTVRSSTLGPAPNEYREVEPAPTEDRNVHIIPNTTSETISSISGTAGALSLPNQPEDLENQLSGLMRQGKSYFL